MKGSIWTDQKCPVCGGPMPYVYRQGCLCPVHQIAATGQFNVGFGRKHHKRFPNLDEAERHLTGVRYETDKGVYDRRDYMESQPLGFTTLAQDWLAQREKEDIARTTLLNCRWEMGRAIGYFGDKSLKEIKAKEVEDFIFYDHRQKKDPEKPISTKTRHELARTFHQFMEWVCRREELPMPQFPPVGFTLGYRDVVDPDAQARILEALKEMCGPGRAKIWFAAKLLSDNPNVRPGELIKVKEKHILLPLKTIVVRERKERDPDSGKEIMLEDEDVAFIEGCRHEVASFPEMRFFRWPKHLSGCIEGANFGPAILNKWWKMAAKKVGIEGVTIYSGTKHSTVFALGDLLTPEQIKRGATLHDTNKAFNRYLKPDQRDKIAVRQALKHVRQESDDRRKKGKLVQLGR